MIDNFIAYQDASYIRGFTVVILDGHGGARQVSHKATEKQMFMYIMIRYSVGEYTFETVIVHNM